MKVAEEVAKEIFVRRKPREKKTEDRVKDFDKAAVEKGGRRRGGSVIPSGGDEGREDGVRDAVCMLDTPLQCLEDTTTTY